MPENPDYTFFLISRQLSGEATAAEKDALQRWLAEDLNNQQQYELLKQLWQAKIIPAARPAGPAKISRILQLATFEEALHEEPEWTPDPSLKKKKSITWKIAAALIAFAFIAWAIMHWATNRNTVAENQIAAQKGSRTRTILPDGSTVWLNGGSTISYAPSYNEESREITLSGEAFFDITKQAGRPFIVYAGALRIKAMSASFNVRSYADDTLIETTVMRGSAELTQRGKKEPVLLHEGQKIIQTAASERSQNSAQQKPSEKVISIDTSLKENERIETAWIYNRLEFRDEDFRSLAKKLERWYNITVHFQDEKVKGLVFNGAIENESVPQAFKALGVAVPFRYTIRGNAVFVRSF